MCGFCGEGSLEEQLAEAEARRKGHQQSGAGSVSAPSTAASVMNAIAYGVATVSAYAVAQSYIGTV